MEKANREILDCVVIKADSIRRRISRNSMFVTTRGPKSPLEAIEDVVVTIIIQMESISQSLCQSKGISLINSLIIGTPHQKELIE